MKDTNTIETYDTWLSQYGGYANSMTMRDYFAAQVLQGIWSKSGGFLPDWAEHEIDIAQVAYEMADEMLKVRSYRG